MNAIPLNEHINGKNQTNKTKNRTYYFYNHQIDLKDFDSKLLKIDKKDYNELIFIILVMWLLKELVIITILIV